MKKFISSCLLTVLLASTISVNYADAKKEKTGTINLNIQTTDTSTPVRKAKLGQGCDCPYDVDKAGKSCGKRSAWNRLSGLVPTCFIGEKGK